MTDLGYDPRDPSEVMKENARVQQRVLDSEDALKVSEEARLAAEQKLAAVREEMDQKLAAALLAVQGMEAPISQVVTDPDHPAFSALLEAAGELRQAAAVAMWIANQRTVRAQNFMSAPSLPQALYDAYCLVYGDQGTWDGLDEEGRRQVKELARLISEQHAQAIEGVGGVLIEETPLIQSVLSARDVVGAAMEPLKIVQESPPYKLLEQLNEYLNNSFPKLVVSGKDPVISSVERAIHIMRFVELYIPQIVKILWDNAVLPTIRTLATYGIDVLPPGTIVHGATNPQVKIHRPE